MKIIFRGCTTWHRIVHYAYYIHTWQRSTFQVPAASPSVGGGGRRFVYRIFLFLFLFRFVSFVLVFSLFPFVSLSHRMCMSCLPYNIQYDEHGIALPSVLYCIRGNVVALRVFFPLNRSFYPSTSSTISVRADSSILLYILLEDIQVLLSQSYATEILRATYQVCSKLWRNFVTTGLVCLLFNRIEESARALVVLGVQA